MDIQQIRTITSPVQVTNEPMRVTIRPMVEQALLKLGADQSLINRINFMNAVCNSTLLLGYIPGQITLTGPGIVVTGADKLLAVQHPDVKQEFVRTCNEHIPQFMWLTWGEDWWNGSHFNVVTTDAGYLEYLRYGMSTRNEQVRGFVKRGRGRPKTGRAKSVRGSDGKYAAWIRECAAYRAQVEQQAKALVELEQHTKERIASLKSDLAERIRAQKDILEDARIALTKLRAQGAPKLEQ